VFTNYSQSRAQLRKVEAALKRIFTGDFGMCAGCGDAIDVKRLQALPWRTTASSASGNPSKAEPIE
jgi:RNA polymerase-binding transcription factor DksA